jgi:hypothetical protein
MHKINKICHIKHFFHEVSVSFGTNTHTVFVTLFLSSNNLVGFWILSMFHSLPTYQGINAQITCIQESYWNMYITCGADRDTKHCRYQIHLTKWAMSDSTNLTRLQNRQQTQTCSSCHWKLTALPSAEMQNQGQHFTQCKISNPCITMHWSADLWAKTKSTTSSLVQ